MWALSYNRVSTISLIHYISIDEEIYDVIEHSSVDHTLSLKMQKSATKPPPHPTSLISNFGNGEVASSFNAKKKRMSFSTSTLR